MASNRGANTGAMALLALIGLGVGATLYVRKRNADAEAEAQANQGGVSLTWTGTPEIPTTWGVSGQFGGEPS